MKLVSSHLSVLGSGQSLVLEQRWLRALLGDSILISTLWTDLPSLLPLKLLEGKWRNEWSYWYRSKCKTHLEGPPARSEAILHHATRGQPPCSFHFLCVWYIALAFHWLPFIFVFYLPSNIFSSESSCLFIWPLLFSRENQHCMSGSITSWFTSWSLFWMILHVGCFFFNNDITNLRQSLAQTY